MKTKTLTTVIAILLLITSNLHAQKKNVLDYYKMLAVSKQYKIVKNGDKYQTEGITETPFDVVVDYKNGFIELSDDGTGGGTITHQVVLYRKADGSALIVHSTKTFDGVDTGSDIDFYVEDSGKLISKKKKYYKSPQSFLKKFYAEFPDELDRNVINEIVSPSFKLPQKGLAITVNFFVRPYIDKDQDRQYQVQQKLLKMKLEPTSWKYIKEKDRFEIVN